MASPASGLSGSAGRLVPLATLRDEAARAVERISLRGVARQIGISAPGLTAILEGAAPRPAARRKLVAWYVRRATPVGISPAVAKAGLALITESLGEPQRSRVQRRVLELIEEGHRHGGTPPPLWLSEMLSGGVQLTEPKP